MKNNYNKFIRAGNNNSESNSENKVRSSKLRAPHNAYFPFSSDYEDESDTYAVRGVSSYQVVETAKRYPMGKKWETNFLERI